MYSCRTTTVVPDRTSAPLHMRSISIPSLSPPSYFSSGFYNIYSGFTFSPCDLLIDSSITRNPLIHSKVILSFPSFLLLLAYNLIRNTEEKNLCSFRSIDTSWHSSSLIYASWWKRSVCSFLAEYSNSLFRSGDWVAHGYSSLYCSFVLYSVA